MPVVVSATIGTQEQNKILELREMEIALSPEIEQRIQDKLDSGAYDSVNALITDALELLDNRDAALRMDVEAVREAVQQGIDDIDAGNGIDGHAFFENLITRGRDATG